MAKVKSPRDAALSHIAQLRFEAKEKGLRDQDIADQMGTTRQTVSLILAGTSMPRLDTFIKMCRVVGWEPENLRGK